MIRADDIFLGQINTSKLTTNDIYIRFNLNRFIKNKEVKPVATYAVDKKIGSIIRVNYISHTDNFINDNDIRLFSSISTIEINKHGVVEAVTSLDGDKYTDQTVISHVWNTLDKPVTIDMTPYTEVEACIDSPPDTLEPDRLYIVQIPEFLESKNSPLYSPFRFHRVDTQWKERENIAGCWLIARHLGFDGNNFIYQSSLLTTTETEWDIQYGFTGYTEFTAISGELPPIPENPYPEFTIPSRGLSNPDRSLSGFYRVIKVDGPVVWVKFDIDMDYRRQLARRYSDSYVYGNLKGGKAIAGIMAGETLEEYCVRMGRFPNDYVELFRREYYGELLYFHPAQSSWIPMIQSMWGEAARVPRILYDKKMNVGDYVFLFVGNIDSSLWTEPISLDTNIVNSLYVLRRVYSNGYVGIADTTGVYEYYVPRYALVRPLIDGEPLVGNMKWVTSHSLWSLEDVRSSYADAVDFRGRRYYYDPCAHVDIDERGARRIWELGRGVIPGPFYRTIDSSTMKTGVIYKDEDGKWCNGVKIIDVKLMNWVDDIDNDEREKYELMRYLLSIYITNETLYIHKIPVKIEDYEEKEVVKKYRATGVIEVV